MGAGASTLAEESGPLRERMLDAWSRVPFARRSKALVAASRLIEEALERTATYDVLVTLYSAASLANTDGGSGTSDPYVVLKLGEVVRQTAYIKNDLNPNFAMEEYAFEAADATVLEVSVYDKDWSTTDDVLGTVSIPLNGAGARHT